VVEVQNSLQELAGKIGNLLNHQLVFAITAGDR
jgi:hypothetical protein